MLQTIRDRSQGLIVGVIVFLISLTFALWGIQSYIDGGSSVVVAEAAGEEILLSEFQDSLQRFRRQAQNTLGDSFDPSAWDSDEVKQRALDGLVDERILAQVIDDARIRVSDVQVARQLQQIPSFQDDDGFSRELYAQRVPLLGLSQAGFEQQLRADMARAQLRAGIAASEFVISAEAEYVERLRKQRRDIGYAIIPESIFDDEVSVSDTELEAYFAEHKERYRTPERVKLDYLEISAAALADEVPVSEDVLRDHYVSNQATYTVSEERNVNHILINVPRAAGLEDEAEALAKVGAAMQRAKSGEAFEQLAEELSDDVGSKAGGGETGFFPRGAMAPEFEEAAFTLEPGEISEPVRTQFGFHLIKLKEIKAGGLKPFDEVRKEVEESYRAAEAQKLFFDQAEQFSNLVYEHPDSLEVASEALGLEIIHTESLSKSEIAAIFSDKVAAAAFETEVLLEGLNAEPVELPDGRVLAVRVGEHHPSTIPALAEVRAQLEQAMLTERKAEMTKAAGEEMIERLRSGATVTELVKDRGYGWETAEAAARDSSKVNRAVLRVAFQTAVKDTDPVYAGVRIGKADYAVIRIANVTTPPVDELEQNDVASLRQQLLSARAENTWREFLRSLRSGSEVRIYRENL